MINGPPAEIPSAGLEDVASAEQFGRFLRWLAVVAFASAAVVFASAAWFSDVRLVVTGGAVLGGGINSLAARRMVATGRAKTAVNVLWAGVIVVGTTMTLCLPEVDAIPVGAVVSCAIVALPYVGKAQLRRLLLVLFLWAGVLSAGREVMPSDPALPGGFTRTIEIAAMLVVLGLALLLLWHFRERLVGLIATARQAETLHRTLVDQLPAVTFIDEITGPGDYDVRPVHISPQVEMMLGYTVEEWLENPLLWVEILHPDDRWAIHEGVDADAGGRPFSAEYRLLSKDGRIVWVQEESVQIRDANGDPRYWQGVMFDITARKQAEEELRESFELLRRTDAERRRLLGELVSAQEEERTRLAGEIHDDPVQKMTAVALRLQMLRRKLSDPDQIATLDQLENTVELAITRLRSLLFELRPPSLDRAGLADTIREYISFADGQLPECRFDNRLVSEPSEGTRTVAYRIAVEALSNVRHHAEAELVEVVLAERDGGLFLRVRDDGVGIPPDVLAGERRHVGLSSMRERAEMAGGWSRIDSRPGAGTTVEAWLPMEATGST